MPREIRPRFKRCYRPEVVGSEALFLLSEKGDVVLTDPVDVLVAPLLTGEHTMEEIFERLSDRVPPQAVMRSLLRLRHAGYIHDAPEASEPPSAFWDVLEVDDATVAERLRERRASVHSFGDVDPGPFVSMLESLGVEVGDDGEHRVALTDDYLQEGLESFGARALEDGRPWLLVKPQGRSIWLGPVFVPARTGCWQCLAHRLRGHRKLETYLREAKGLTATPRRPPASLPTTLHAGLSLAATEVYKWIVCGESERLEGSVLTLDTASLHWRTHRLVQRPQCPACGAAEAGPAKEPTLTLRSRKKVFTADGGHRSVMPREAFERLAHHISPVTGIVGSLHRAESSPEEARVTPSYIADYGLPGTVPDVPRLLEVLHQRAGGKGMTHEQARMSALGEAIERYCGVFQGDEPRIRASLAELGERGIHPNACMSFSDRQIAERETTNETCTRSTWVAGPFDETEAIEWTPVRSLTEGTTRYLPTAQCFYGYSDLHGIEFTRANSNGSAAGTNKEEAILQGFMELVERDAVALWWYNRIRRRGVDLDDFDEPYVHDLRARYQVLHRELWVLDVTSDIGIPVFAAVSRRVDKQPEDIILGFGAHLDPRTALLRALTELNQSLPPVASVEGDRGYSGVNQTAISWWRSATIESQPHLCPDESGRLETRASYSSRASDDLRDDIAICVQSVQDRGMETLVLDQTRADVGLDVVKVVVPGMRHFWPRFGPGRLFDVPVAMGWLETPRREDELNTNIVYF